MTDVPVPTVEVLKSDALVDIQIGTAFYQDLQKALLFLNAEHDPTFSERALEQIQSKNFTDPKVHAYATIMLLCVAIEDKARMQGLTYQKTIIDPRLN